MLQEDTPSTANNVIPPPVLVGDHLALNFLNTIAAPKGTLIEWIGSGHDFVRWLVAAEVLEAAESQRIEATWPGTELDGVAHEAMDFREWFRGAVTNLKRGGPKTVSVHDLERLNGVLAQGATFLRVERVPEGGSLCQVTLRQRRDPKALLTPIAESMADLLCQGDFNLIRRCENPPCPLWFYDHTKSHRRRWCSPAVCGNRAKVAAHRQRKRLAAI